MTPHSWSTVSLGGAVATFLLHWSGIFQSLAALIAIIAGLISIYKSIKKNHG